MASLKKVTVYGFILSLVLLSLSSIPAMLANIYAHQFERYEVRWNKSPATLHVLDWLSAEKSLASALEFDALNPNYLEMQGRLYSWFLLLPENSVKNKGLSDGLEALNQSLILRPYWSYGWSVKALFKRNSGEIDAEFWEAYKNALRSGSWEPEVFYNLSHAGFSVWRDLSWEQRIEVAALFKRAAVFHEKIARRVFAIAKSYNMHSSLCFSLKSIKEPTFLDRQCGKKS